jgi:tetratricopeptide (TPR) repeat protein
MNRPPNAEPSTPGWIDNPIWVFTPSRTDPKDLEFILVQRHGLIQDAVDRIRESALTEHKHFLLFVGPRGCGKTHLVSLVVNRLAQQHELDATLRIAWLNEDETCTTLLELLLKIYGSLATRYPAEYSTAQLGDVYDLAPEVATRAAAELLMRSLGTRTLLLVSENLDALFESLGAEGQKRLRAFIQEHSQLAILATAQRLVEDLSSRVSPFFGFFQTEHLKTLNLDEAVQLLQNIARLQRKDGVVAFLATRKGRGRVRALHHLSGGNHRVFVVLSQFIGTDPVDALQSPFLKMVDELTPYYQERIRALPPMQRKIVEYLCICEGTMSVKEIARRLFATPQTISSQLQNLRKNGYVEANQRGRESFYEISEPLMRICIEVKDSQSGQPLRLLVDFLRVWYDADELTQRFNSDQPNVYIEAALRHNKERGNLRKKIFIDDILEALPQRVGYQDQLSIGETLNTFDEGVLQILDLTPEEWRSGAGQQQLDELIDTQPNSTAHAEIIFQVTKGLLIHTVAFDRSGHAERAIDGYTTVINIPNAPTEPVVYALFNRGILFDRTGQPTQANADYTTVINTPNIPTKQVVDALINRGILLGQNGDTKKAITDYTTIINTPNAPTEQVIQALNNRGITFGESGDIERAIADFNTIINTPNAPTEQVIQALNNRGITFGESGDTERAIADFNTIINTPNAPTEQVIQALNNRGITFGESGDTERAIADFNTNVNTPNAPTEQVIQALSNRGVACLIAGRHEESRADFLRVTQIVEAPAAVKIDLFCNLAELEFADGRWAAGFEALSQSLSFQPNPSLPYRPNATDLVDVLFRAGLGPDGRRDKINRMFAMYSEHDALPVLGQALVASTGKLFRAGDPFPSTDNLEDWFACWESAAAEQTEFRLSLRLFRAGIDFIQSNGSYASLLRLTSPERLILEQAFGFASGLDHAS